MNLNERVFNIKSNNDLEEVNNLIEEYIPFIINTISKLTGRYVEVENSEELSIGLMAFHEAINSFDTSKGAFLAYAKLVVQSRIKNHFRKEAKHRSTSSINEINSEGEKKLEGMYYTNEKSDLAFEIEAFEDEIRKFGFDLEKLADESPKHKETRKKHISLGSKAGKDVEVTQTLYEKLRLPITFISNKYKLTIKVIKSHKTFITSTIIIFFKDFIVLQNWIKDGDE